MTFRQTLDIAFYDRVHADLRRRMAVAGIDLLLLDSADDVIYTTGFSHYPTERPVIFALTADRALLLLPQLEVTHAAHQKIAAEPVVYFEFPGVDRPLDVLSRALPMQGGMVAHSLGMSVGRAAQVAAAFAPAQVVATDLVVRARMIKYPEEIVLHREAARLSDAMVEAGVELIRDALRAGRALPSEIEIESHVSRTAIAMMHAEHEDVMLVTGLASGLVYSGTRSAFPHAMPTHNPVARGESIILSLGCRVGGRAAESERTFFIGEPTAAQAEHYSWAFDAQAIATSGLRAGNTCAAADHAALQHIRDLGKGQHLLHRSGHGMGVMFHEPPWVEEGDPTVLETGMICSSEPSITIPEFAGYRIADTVLVGADGPDSLTHYPRAIDQIIIT
ncbi:proline dipeptidase [Ketogulonicigenium robustum]|uniref:Proline dipeptidase n=1 Tax=Ketogulonicigenium robustum TaxID=92947 RepID=A0A1W6NZJ9_9RHOB|nr:Xaa-Pro peptidase family protein [Ketogulonicigenium robustum]ARO14634.1 proline dipeptidase [Ketogulonicigenium robustum]